MVIGVSLDYNQNGTIQWERDFLLRRNEPEKEVALHVIH
jgi:hypothetical protein